MKKILIVFVVVILIVCYCTNTFAVAAPMSYTIRRIAKIAMTINGIGVVISVMVLGIVINLLRKDKKKKINILVTVIMCIQILICLSALFISKVIYNIFSF